MEIEDDYILTASDSTCGEHISPARFALKVDFGSVVIPLCQTCIDELYEAILPHVSAEVRDRNA